VISETTHSRSIGAVGSYNTAVSHYSEVKHIVGGGPLRHFVHIAVTMLDIGQYVNCYHY